MQVRWQFVVIVMLTVGSVATALAADINEKAVVEYREHVMESVGAHMKSIVAILKGEVAYQEQLAGHAEGLAISAKLAKRAFQDQAMTSDSEAKPAIWENWEKFAKGMDGFAQATQVLAEVAKTGDMPAIGKQVQEVGEYCKGCHKRFKE